MPKVKNADKNKELTAKNSQNKTIPIPKLETRDLNPDQYKFTLLGVTSDYNLTEGDYTLVVSFRSPNLDFHKIG